MIQKVRLLYVGGFRFSSGFAPHEVCDGFGIVDPSTGFLVWGWNIDLDAQEVIDWCEDEGNN